MPKFKTTIEVEVEVEYTVEPSQKGCCDSMGVPEEPSFDAYVDEVYINSVPDCCLPEETIKQIRKEAEEHFNELEKEFE